VGMAVTAAATEMVVAPTVVIVAVTVDSAATEGVIAVGTAVIAEPVVDIKVALTAMTTIVALLLVEEADVAAETNRTAGTAAAAAPVEAAAQGTLPACPSPLLPDPPCRALLLPPRCPPRPLRRPPRRP
jgi:hypothetical protein